MSYEDYIEYKISNISFDDRNYEVGFVGFKFTKDYKNGEIDHACLQLPEPRRGLHIINGEANSCLANSTKYWSDERCDIFHQLETYFNNYIAMGKN